MCQNGGHIIRSATAKNSHVNIKALSSTEPELLPIEFFHIPAMQILRIFAKIRENTKKNCLHPAKNADDAKTSFELLSTKIGQTVRSVYGRKEVTKQCGLKIDMGMHNVMHMQPRRFWVSVPCGSENLGFPLIRPIALTNSVITTAIHCHIAFIHNEGR